MARLSVAALLLFSLLAIAHAGSALKSDASALAVEERTYPVSVAAKPTAVVPADEEVPAEQQHGLLRLPSHRIHRHRPCRHGLAHRHLWWARHHGVVVPDAGRFHRYGKAPPQAVAVFPAEASNEPREAELYESKPVEEPNPDRSLPDTDGEGELVARDSFVSRDGHDEIREDEDPQVMAWKREMLWRRFDHGLRRHHDDEEQDEGAGATKRFRIHHHDDEEEDAEKKMRKRFHFQHHHDEEDEEEEKKMRKRFHHAEHDDSGSDSEEEDDDQVEELVRRFRKAILRRRFGHGRRFHRHHHGHRHAEEARDKADGEEETGVMSWIKGLMNRF